MSFFNLILTRIFEIENSRYALAAGAANRVFRAWLTVCSIEILALKIMKADFLKYYILLLGSCIIYSL